MMHFNSNVQSILWGVEDECQAQTIRIDDEIILLWHSFPEGARRGQIEVDELRSASTPELRSEVIYMPGGLPKYDYQICASRKLTEHNYRALQSLHLVADQFGGPFVHLDNTSEVMIKSDTFKITLYQRGQCVGFIWEELYIDEPLDYIGDYFRIAGGRRTRLDAAGAIRINPFKSKLGYSWCPTEDRAATVWQHMRCDFIKMESEIHE